MADSLDQNPCLPNELRLQILEELLVFPASITFPRLYSDVQPPKASLRYVWKILHICKMFRVEGLPLLFSKNTFALTHNRRGAGLEVVPGRFFFHAGLVL
jgi:hypothetical protein